MKKIRLLLIEDNSLLREGVTAIIRKEPDLKLIAASANLRRRVLAAGQKPHVVLLDQCLQTQDSLRATEMVKKEIPQAKVIVMGLIPVKADVVEFVKAGASGFVLKDSTIKDFLKTIRSVAARKKVIPPQLNGSLFIQIVADAERNGKARVSDVRLTRRHREIIDLIAEGLTNKEIAQRLHVATYTVKSHVHAVLEKLALHTRLEVAIYAQRKRRKNQTDAILSQGPSGFSVK